MTLLNWLFGEPELSRVQIVAALFKLDVIRPEKPRKPGELNLRIVRSDRQRRTA